MTKNELRVEFHCHTIQSKDSLTTPENLLESCRAKKIDRIVITDHNTIAGALIARELDPERVIIGEEIMTPQGEILAAFVQQEIPGGLEPMEVIGRLREQQAFISLSHPFDRLRDGHWELEALLQIIPHVDAIEIFNSRNMWPGGNRQAKAFAEEHALPGTVGSDAHTAYEIGKAVMLLPDFNDAASLKAAVHNARYETKKSGFWIHFASRYAVWKKSRME
jgi:predicted metal-dependent phosphoesterase TrpH